MGLETTVCYSVNRLCKCFFHHPTQIHSRRKAAGEMWRESGSGLLPCNQANQSSAASNCTSWHHATCDAWEQRGFWEQGWGAGDPPDPSGCRPTTWPSITPPTPCYLFFKHNFAKSTGQLAIILFKIHKEGQSPSIRKLVSVPSSVV